MSDSPVRRRRRRRRGKRQGEKTTYQPRESREPPPKPALRPLPEWNWRTFPVFFAFVAGIVIMGLVAPTPLGLIFFGGLFGLAYGVAHILTRMWVTRRRG